MKLNDFDNIFELQQASPIKKYCNHFKESSFFDYEMEELQKIEKIIKINRENLNQPLKVVILGEVKAGKSTLVNTLIGKQVSYTNVVEATASIVEIKYAAEEKIIIHLKEGKNLICDSLEELNVLMDEKRQNLNFFKNVEKIEIQTQIDRLKEITIVDTPGLNTITKENEERTENYLANADVVLWVLNAHHLGQLDVLEKIEDVMDYGKPIIGIINRIDEIIGSSANDLVDYVENEMGYLFDKLFATSAQKAWEGINENNIAKINESKIPELFHYLIDHIEKDAESVQLDSVIHSIILQCQRDCYIHKSVVSRIQQLLTQYEEDKKEFHNFNIEIKRTVKNKISEWIRNDFFKNERLVLENCKLENLENYIKNHYSEEYIEKIIYYKYEQLANYILEEWTVYTEKIIDRQPIDLIVPIESVNVTEYNNDLELTYTGIVEGVTRGGVTAGAVGLGLAGYSAILGPAAASVTLVSALSTILPPLLIAGGIAGGVWKLFDKERTKRQNEKLKSKIVENLIEDLKKVIESDVSDEIIKNLNTVSDQYYEMSIEMLASIFKQCSSSYNEMEQLQGDIKKYVRDISQYLNHEKIEYKYKWSQYNNSCKLDKDINNHSLTKEELEQMISNKFDIETVTKDITNQVINCIQSGEVDPYNTKQLKNEEIRQKFIESFAVVEEELDIISPWIGRWVLGDKILLNAIENALKKGVTIKILYGIEDSQSYGKSCNDNRGIATLKNAQELQERFNYSGPGKLILKQGNTHQKILLCDEKYLLSGSFNLLSFKGNYEDEDTRDESMEYLEHKKHIQDLRKEYFSF